MKLNSSCHKRLKFLVRWITNLLLTLFSTNLFRKLSLAKEKHASLELLEAKMMGLRVVRRSWIIL